MSNPKETVYDSHISPLVTQIIQLCKDHKINAFLTFALDKNEQDKVMRCTTSLPSLDPDDEEGKELICKLFDITKPKEPIVFAYSIITNK